MQDKTQSRRSLPWTILLACVVVGLAGKSLGDERPNIVFMLSDDQHWDESSVAMHPDAAFSLRDELHTPNLQVLAERGMRFSAAYSPGPVCSPTRISILTGLSPATLHWTRAGPSINASKNPILLPPQSKRSIDADYVTFAELLQQAGYRTAHLGKWHLQSGGPENHGYDVSDGNIGNEASGKYQAPNPVDLFGMAQRAEAFMAEAKADGEPFFIQLSWLALHSPENALPETIAKYEQAGLRGRRGAPRAALTENMDTAVGRVMDAVDRLGLTGNTYVIFMSDNGGNSRDTIRGRKGTLYEGGIRVPLLVQGPGIAAGSWSHTRVIGHDFYPTFLDWAGVEIPAETAASLEGGSLAKLLKGEADQVERQREELVFHFPHYQTEEGPHSAIYLGPYKLIKFYENDRVQLYNIDTDLREQNNLAEQSPEIAADLKQKLEAYLTEIDADLPTPNDAYDPSKPTEINGERDGPPNGERRRERRPAN